MCELLSKSRQKEVSDIWCKRLLKDVVKTTKSFRNLGINRTMHELGKLVKLPTDRTTKAMNLAVKIPN